MDILHVTVQKRSLSWPQDLDGEMRFVELYIVSDFAHVSWTPLDSTEIYGNISLRPHSEAVSLLSVPLL